MKSLLPHLYLLLIPLIPWIETRAERAAGGSGAQSQILYLWRGEEAKALFPGFEGLMADIYWLRTVQYFGGSRVFGEGKDFSLLAPLIDITVTLDPRLKIAYLYGATFLSEPRPAGADEPEKGVALLQRAVEEFPRDWSIRQNLAFFMYLFLRDHQGAAQVLLDAAKLPGAPYWLESLAGQFLEKGGEREVARRIWTRMYEQADAGAIKWNARFNLQRLDALDTADALARLVERYRSERGERPARLEDLEAAHLLKAVPEDPAGTAFAYDPATGSVTISRRSPLWTPNN